MRASALFLPALLAALGASGCSPGLQSVNTARLAQPSPMKNVLERYSKAFIYEDRGVAFIWSSAENGHGLYADTIQFETRYDRRTGHLRLEYWRERPTEDQATHRVLELDDGEDFDENDVERSGRNRIHEQVGVSAGLSRIVPLLVHGISPWTACPVAAGSQPFTREIVGKARTTKTAVQVPPCDSVFAWVDDRDQTIRKLAIRTIAEAPAIRERLATLRSLRPDLRDEIDQRIASTTSSEVTDTIIIFDARLDGGDGSQADAASR